MWGKMAVFTCRMSVGSCEFVEKDREHFKDDFSLSTCRGTQPLERRDTLPLPMAFFIVL